MPHSLHSLPHLTLETSSSWVSPFYRKGTWASFNSLAQVHTAGTHTPACLAPVPSPQHHTGSQEARVPVPDLLLINLYHWASVSSLFKITGAGIENGLSGPFKLYCSEKVGLMKSDSSPGRREGYVWIRQDPRPRLTAQHQPTEVQRRREMSPGLQSISRRLLPLPRGQAEMLLQLYWDDEAPLGWWKGRRGGVRGYNGRSDSFSLEKRRQEGPVFNGGWVAG